MKKRYRFLNITIILTLLMGFFVIPVAAVETGPGDSVAVKPDSGDIGQYANYSRTQGAPKPSDEWTAVAMTDVEIVQDAVSKGTGVYIVQLVDAPLALYTGGVPGLAATNPAAAGAQKLDANSPASLAYRTYLAGKRDGAVRLANKALGRTLNIKFEYEAALNGFASEMSAQEAAQLTKLPEVWRVDRERMQYIQTDAGPEWIGAFGIWDGTSTGGLPGTKGEGIIVGVIDTGIDPWNPSFADVGGDSYDHTNPWGSGTYAGVCDSTNTSPPAGVVAYDATFPCNDKLIGVWGYTAADANPRDTDGHGSHTSSTAAGNVTYNTTITMPNGLAFSNDISGVAPHANIIMYDACADTGGCPGAALSKARDQAILDGVDVINYSIGGAYWPDPWADVDALSWLSIRAAGIFAATSAGNDGPAPGTLGSPAAFPWVTSVGNLTHNRAYVNTLVLTNSNPLSDSIELVGLGMTSGMTQTARVVYSIDYANPPTITVEDARLCGKGDSDFPDNPFPPGTFNGEIVVCERGIYPRVSKSQLVFEAGAGGFVLAQPVAAGGGPGSRVADPHALPGLHIDYNTYQTLKAAVANGFDMGIIPGSNRILDASYADIMAAGSSRGPNGSVPDLIVPSVAAPGSSIWAAYHIGDSDGEYTYNMIGGTSMASPHVAGAFALLKDLRPGWSPAEAQSAVMLTADTTVLKDDAVTPASPFDTGSGRIDVGLAAQSGLVMEITEADYQAANPASGGDPKDLNTPSMANSQCVGACSWERTLTSAVAYTVTWTASADPAVGTSISVTPSSFELGPGESQVVEVEYDVNALDAAEWVFGSVTFTPDTVGTPQAHMPLAVIPVQSTVPDDQLVVTQRNAGSKMLTDLLSKLAIANLTGTFTGLQLPDENMLSVFQHALPTDDFPEVFFTDVGNVGVVTLTVPAGAARLVAEVMDTTSPDLDMLVLYDQNGNGAPEFADLANDNFCQSASGGPYEYCSILEPPVGTWWALILNYEASTVGQPDPVTLGTAILTVDAGNLILDGPGAVAQGTPYSATVLFDEMMTPGKTWYGAVALSTDTGEAPFGMFAFDVVRLSDDVQKDGPAGALVGATVMYTITVDANTHYDVPLTYMITDTLPAGMTLVPGSASATMGTVSEVGNSVLWSGTMEVPVGVYLATDNNVDPTCDTPFGGYVNLSAFGIYPDPGISGDTQTWWYDSLGAGTDFYGAAIAKPYFTDDGFTMFSANDHGTDPWTNQDLPDSSLPNGITAQYWRDMEISYSPPPTNTGVSAATAGALWLVEFDDANVYGEPTETLDYEIVAWISADPSPGSWDIMYAYDNVNISDTVGTVGIENATGTIATQYAYDDFTPTDGLVVCLDWVYPDDPAVITFEAMIETDVTDAFLVNTVVHDTDMLGHKPESTEFTTGIATVSKIAPSLVTTGSTMSYKLMMNSFAPIGWFVVTDTIPVGTSYAGGVDATGGLAIFDAGSDAVVWTSLVNEVVDPGFELAATTPGWEEGGDIAGPTCSETWCGEDAAHTGDYYLWFGGWGVTNMAYVSQTVSIPVASEAVLTYWIAVGANPVADEIVLEVELDGVLLAIYTEEDALVYGTYKQVAIDISAFADGGDHVLVLQGTEIGTTLANIFVDDVSIVAGKEVTSNSISMTFDVLVTGALGTSITNTAHFDIGSAFVDIDAVTDIRSFFWMPRIMRNYSNQP